MTMLVQALSKRHVVDSRSLGPERMRSAPRRVGEAAGLRPDGSLQLLTLTLDGITAGDYLCWVYDPEPRTLGHELRSIKVSADPLGDRIAVELCWECEPPDAYSAALAAGFSLTPEVAKIVANELGRVNERSGRTVTPARG